MLAFILSVLTSIFLASIAFLCPHHLHPGFTIASFQPHSGLNSLSPVSLPTLWLHYTPCHPNLFLWLPYLLSGFTSPMPASSLPLASQPTLWLPYLLPGFTSSMPASSFHLASLPSPWLPYLLPGFTSSMPSSSLPLASLPTPWLH